MILDPQAGLASARESRKRGAKSGFPWGEAIGATVTGMIEAIIGDEAAASESFSHALGIQRQLGDWEGGGMSLGGLASLAAHRGEPADALELYRQALTAFETCGDRGEEAEFSPRWPGHT